jgi:hypothetical protein
VQGRICSKVVDLMVEHYMVIVLEGSQVEVQVDRKTVQVMKLLASIGLRLKMMAGPVVEKRVVVHLPAVKSCEVERGLLAVVEAALVLLLHHMQALVGASRDLADLEKET